MNESLCVDMTGVSPDTDWHFVRRLVGNAVSFTMRRYREQRRCRQLTIVACCVLYRHAHSIVRAIEATLDALVDLDFVGRRTERSFDGGETREM
jgi:hypothetical protein